MSIIFENSNKRNRVREPIFQKNRVKYKGYRNSTEENLETNLLKLDITRIYNELETIDLSVLDKLETIVVGNFPLDNSIKLQDGISNTVDDVQFYYDELESSLENLELHSINKLSGILNRIISKVQRLETGLWVK